VCVANSTDFVSKIIFIKENISEFIFSIENKFNCVFVAGNYIIAALFKYYSRMKQIAVDSYTVFFVFNLKFIIKLKIVLPVI